MILKAVIFDLDGTLVDSAPGVFFSMLAALQANGVKSAIPLTNSLIGPPLGESLQLLCPGVNENILKKLISAFKENYDFEGYLLTKPFFGVSEMLAALVVANVPLFIATNKRKIPARKIVDKLGWTGYFEAVYSPDSILPAAQAKVDLLNHILEAHGLERTSVVYVGDRLDDAEAARQSGVHFFHASWGYENLSGLGDHEIMNSVQHLQRSIELGFWESGG